MTQVFDAGLAKFGYDFIVRKRILKRFWSVIGAHLQAA
jgi:hypothetical protein